jgi:hypothetical protein
MCPVCFTGGDPVTRETLNAGIGVLLGVTVVVLGLFARFFLTLARRSRAAAHLVDHSGRPSLSAVASASAKAPADTSAKAEGRPDDKRAA